MSGIATHVGFLLVKNITDTYSKQALGSPLNISLKWSLYDTNGLNGLNIEVFYYCYRCLVCSPVHVYLQCNSFGTSFEVKIM